MPPKTAKLKKKTENNKTKKKKATRKQFNVDGKKFRLKDDSSQVRIELTDSGDIIKFKYYDASENSISDLSETYTFEIYEVVKVRITFSPNILQSSTTASLRLP